MNSLFLVFALLVTVPTVPPPEIIAKEATVTPGRNIRLSIKPIDKSAGLTSIAYTWIINPPVDDLDEWPDNTHICFGSGIVEQTFDVTVIGSFVFQDEAKVVTLIQKKASIQINVINPPNPIPPGPQPPIPPGPTPTPGPIPDGKYKLGAFMFDLARLMPKDQCNALADSLSAIAKKAREGFYPTKAALVQATKDAGNQVLGPALDSWKPILDRMAAKLNTLKTELPTPQASSVAYDELATGLYAAGGK
jgi:hypothetical protein